MSSFDAAARRLHPESYKQEANAAPVVEKKKKQKKRKAEPLPSVGDGRRRRMRTLCCSAVMRRVSLSDGPEIRAFESSRIYAIAAQAVTVFCP